MPRLLLMTVKYPDMNKNDIITLQITDISSEGSGIGHYDGMAVFVPQTAIGDKISARILKVKKSYAFARIEKIIEGSSCRIPVDCPSFNRCGGCTLRHIGYSSECEFKYNRVKETMHRIGGVQADPMPIVPSPDSSRYRNKAQYPIANDGTAGFYAPRSHRIIPCSDCLLEPPQFSLCANALKEWINRYSISVYNEETNKGLVRHLYLRKAKATNQILAVIVINGQSLPHSDALVSSFKDILGDSLKSVQLNINTKPTNVVLGDKNILLYGDSYITDILCGINVRISPHSFYQVNRDAAELLYGIARRYTKPENKTVLDLYCGAGTIGLSMAKAAKSVIGVEIVPEAVNDADFNSKANGIENARFLCADAANAAIELATEGIKPDVVILDPPRKGCDVSLLNTVAKDFSPDRIVYVSCDVATLARDTAILHTLGYKILEYTPVDMFPRTTHVETVALFVLDINS